MHKLSRSEKEKLARNIGVSRQYIEMILNRRRIPSPVVAEKLEEALGVERSAWIWPEKYANPYLRPAANE